ncbi:MAG: hypothetical protein RIC55_21550 [Pirellulaceae bacterium]
MVRRRPRRGLVLMLVLTLLTLFALMAVTFVLITGVYEDTSRAHAKQGIRRDPPNKLMDRVLYDLVRDTNDTLSPMRGHGLLMDFYGVDARTGTLGNQRPLPDTGDQFIQYDCQFDAPAQAFDQVRGFYEGCVITFTTGAAKNLSTRVVFYDMVAGSPVRYRIRFLVPKNDQGITIRPGNGANFLINGRPFNGTGFGYNPTSGRLDASTNPGTDPPIALLPNTAANGGYPLYMGVSNGGDADESYDAADYNNMFLAALIPNPANENQVAMVVPSYHRSALVNYFRQDWMSNGAPADAQNRVRQFILRPLPTQHPDFTGGNSNPRLWTPASVRANGFTWTDADIDNLLRGLSEDQVWDVDNDGDGVMDSIWLDLGYPTMTDASGRTFRPLFAILCTDLDGRLNVNAHGNRWHTAGTQPAAALLAGGSDTSGLAGGPGHGPPAISLGGLGINTAQYNSILNLRGGPPGENLPGTPGFIDQRNFPDLIDTPGNFYNNPVHTSWQSPPDLRDRLAVALDHYGQPVYERTPEAAGTDLRVDLDYELDHSPDAPRGENFGRDALFSYGELERLLRLFDVDATSLPDRLQFLLSPSGNPAMAAANSRIVTTDSFDPPSPAIRYTRDMLADIAAGANAPNPAHPQRAFSFLDLLRFRLMNSGAGFTQDQIDNEIGKMLPYDLRRGLRWDVNMPFGNGQDSNGNNVTDEHGVISLPGGPVPFEAVGTSEFMPAIPNPTAPYGPGGNYVASVPFHALNGINPRTSVGGSPFDGNPDINDRMMVRQLYARYLYVLLMTLSDPNAHIPEFEYDGNPGVTSPDERARGFAQWAINVVDFRDADSIMTPFEYDSNPFNGWGVNGVINDGGSDDQPAESFVVWGCERPELLISETLAWHDRRTEDLMTEDPPNGKLAGPDMTTDDNDFDQRLRPRGPFFVELYNPWTSPSTSTPAGSGPQELYYGTQGVVLTSRAPPNPNIDPTTGAPVWRLIVVRGTSHAQSADPDLPPSTPPLATDFDPNDVERGIYFVDPGPSLPGGVASGHGQIRYFTDQAVAPVLPGRYAVLGSAHYESGGNYIEPVGRLDDPTVNESNLMLGSTRRIVLTPHIDPDQSNVRVIDNGTTEPAHPNIQHPVGIVMNRPRPMSISEPATSNGYGDFDGAATFNSDYPNPGDPNNDGRYESGGAEQPLDEPLDLRRTDFTATEKNALMSRDGTTTNFRTVHLQRLANPLAPWHSTRNPYLTIDTASVDLTAFNGVETANETYRTDGTFPAVATDPDPDLEFNSHERGDKAQASDGLRNLWRKERIRVPSDITGQSPDGLPVMHHFPYQLSHTLGRLNAAFGTAYNDTTKPNPPYPSGPNLGSRYYVGAPNTAGAPAFPWLNWNNRPFVSGLELSQVPYTRSSRLLYSYSPIDATTNSYLPGQTTQFGHLMNFYQSGSGGAPAGNLHRLFEFVHVPSKFASSNTLLHPEFFTANLLPDGSTNNPRHIQSGAGTQQFHPPYNKVSNYRDPGRVNINTVYSQRVWQSLFYQGFGPAHGGPTFFGTAAAPGWIDSRRGYGGTAVAQTQMSPSSPTLFANPMRGAGSSDLVPLPSMLRSDVETTLLRSNAIGGGPTGTPLFDVSSNNVANDTDRNPFFRRQSMQRMANLVTCRSNVYAIWMTVGYFEVDPNTQQLGRELGSDTGQVERHRAFYIVDRSIPVGFQPGKNLNVDKAIRLRRYIE